MIQCNPCISFQAVRSDLAAQVKGVCISGVSENKRHNCLPDALHSDTETLFSLESIKIDRLGLLSGKVTVSEQKTLPNTTLQLDAMTSLDSIRQVSHIVATSLFMLSDSTSL